jgi:hypothetical protein
MSTKQEHFIISAIDNKARLDKATSVEECQAILITSGILPPTNDMPLTKARNICKNVYRTLSGINFLAQMYNESLKDMPLSQTAAAFPYVLKKEPEETNVNIWEIDPLEGLTDEEKSALRKFTAATMRQKIGISTDNE